MAHPLTPMTVQYTIPFHAEPDFSEAALIDHPGLEEARAWLNTPTNWPTATLILSGEPSSGKSHLAALSHADLEIWDLVHTPLDNQDKAEALFHKLNHIQAYGLRLLILSRTDPKEIYPALADLDSRLKAASHVKISEPKDEGIRQAILFKICTDYQLRLDMETAAYICTRLPQSLQALTLFCEMAGTTHLKAGLSKIAAKPLIEDVEQALRDL